MSTSPAQRHLYATDEAARLTDATPRQIDHAVGTGLIQPAEEAPRRGMSRKFDFNNLVEIALVARLYWMGVSPSNISALLKTVRQQWHLLVRDSERGAFWRNHPRKESAVLCIFYWLTPMGTRPDISLCSVKKQQDLIAEGWHGISISLLSIIEQLEEETGDTIIDPSGVAYADPPAKGSLSHLTDSETADFVAEIKAKSKARAAAWSDWTIDEPKPKKKKSKR